MPRPWAVEVALAPSPRHWARSNQEQEQEQEQDQDHPLLLPIGSICSVASVHIRRTGPRREEEEEEEEEEDLVFVRGIGPGWWTTTKIGS